MAPFDPYYKWLGIPPEEQPVTYYRLLGIPEFEWDADVIEAGAEQRTVFLRSFQTGPNAELAERLLNEISEARVNLLDGKTKARYDTQLRAARQAASPPEQALPEVVIAPPIPEEEYIVEVEDNSGSVAQQSVPEVVIAPPIPEEEYIVEVEDNSGSVAQESVPEVVIVPPIPEEDDFFEVEDKSGSVARQSVSELGAQAKEEALLFLGSIWGKLRLARSGFEKGFPEFSDWLSRVLGKMTRAVWGLMAAVVLLLLIWYLQGSQDTKPVVASSGLIETELEKIWEIQSALTSAEVISRYEDLISKYKLTDEQRQEVLYYKSSAHYRAEEKQEAKRLLVKAKKLAPESELVSAIDRRLSGSLKDVQVRGVWAYVKFFLLGITVLGCLVAVCFAWVFYKSRIEVDEVSP